MNGTRTHPAVIRYGLCLYFSSRSFGLAVARSRAPLKKKEAMCRYGTGSRKKYSADCADIFQTNKRTVKEIIFVDETLLKIRSELLARGSL
jgi:hypothetical protein